MFKSLHNGLKANIESHLIVYSFKRFTTTVDIPYEDSFLCTISVSYATILLFCCSIKNVQFIERKKYFYFHQLTQNMTVEEMP